MISLCTITCITFVWVNEKTESTSLEETGSASKINWQEKSRIASWTSC